MAAVFLSGVVVGVVGHELYSGDAVRAKSHKDWSPEEWRRHYVDVMQSRLSLSTQQLARLNEILDRSRDRFVALDEEVIRPQKHAIRHEQIESIEAMLTESQRLEYEKLRQERAEKRQKRNKEKKGR